MTGRKVSIYLSWNWFASEDPDCRFSSDESYIGQSCELGTMHGGLGAIAFVRRSCKAEQPRGVPVRSPEEFTRRTHHETSEKG